MMGVIIDDSLSNKTNGLQSFTHFGLGVCESKTESKPNTDGMTEMIKGKQSEKRRNKNKRSIENKTQKKNKKKHPF